MTILRAGLCLALLLASAGCSPPEGAGDEPQPPAAIAPDPQPAAPPAAPPPAAGDSVVRVSGTITDEGVECPVLRTEDGTLYSLTGELGDAGPGDRVQVEGPIAEMSICMQGTTLEVRTLRRL